MHDLQHQSDHDLLAAGRDEVIAENRAAASRSQRLVALFRRHRAEEDTDDPTQLTARDYVAVEVSELWAIPSAWARRQLNDALWTDEHFPFLRDLAAAGSIDAYRVSLIATTARHGLDTPEEYAELARRLEPFLRRHLRPDGLVACSHKQLRNKLAYVIRVLRVHDAEERFRNAHRNREVVVGAGEDGVSWLTLSGTTDRVAAANHRLDLNARALRASGDERTVQQIRADLALDLLIAGTTTDAPVPRYARPVVNLTVPIQTVMGLADVPGVLSGGQVVPASLARQIAQRPGATWHRMLTDPAGRCVELSTARYEPTAAIWEQVVATRPTCFRAGCDHPSALADLDHIVRWPDGPTTPDNLWPACRGDHRVKHARGFRIVQADDGTFALRTRAGFTHTVLDVEHPTTAEWPELPEHFQFSATEIQEAVAHAQELRLARAVDRMDLAWEHVA